MKELIKKILLRLPIISHIYLRYCAIMKALNQQKKSINELKSTSKKQKETIKALSAKNKENNKVIKKLTDEINSHKCKLAQQEALIKKYEEESNRSLNDVRNGIKSADDKIREERRHSDELVRKLGAELTREINRNHIMMKNSERDLKARINYKYIQGLHRDDYKKALTEWLMESTGEIGDLDNPKTFNEKIQWLKLHSEKEIYSILADKYRVREWVADKIGNEYLVPLIGAWDDFDDIDFDSFPEKFVLKANHGCRYNYIVYDKKEFNKADAKNKFTKWMRENFAWNSLELQYNSIPRKIIAEEYMENSEKNLNDYKIFCFDGKPKYIMFLTDRMESLKMAIFDLEWNRMPFTYNFPQYTGELEKPAQLEELIRLAGVLAEGFPHVRVDFYVLNDGSIKFGEMTFTTSSGFCRFDPPEYNRILGDMITLPTENK